MTFNLSTYTKFLIVLIICNNSYTKTEMKTVSVSSVGWRIKGLKCVVDSLLPQVDKINVFLQKYDSIPEFLNNPKINVVTDKQYLSAGKLGACAKFFWANETQGYHFIVDDDLLYPSNYISYCISKVEQYKRKAIIGFHGILIKKDKVTIWERNNDEMEVYDYNSALTKDKYVNILGTGSIAFHSDTIHLPFDKFTIPNKADSNFKQIAKEQNIPFIIVERKKDYISMIRELSNDPKALWMNLQNREKYINLVNTYAPYTLITITGINLK